MDTLVVGATQRVWSVVRSERRCGVVWPRSASEASHGHGLDELHLDYKEGPKVGGAGSIVTLGVFWAESQRSVFCAGNWWWCGWYGGRYGVDGA